MTPSAQPGIPPKGAPRTPPDIEADVVVVGGGVAGLVAGWELARAGWHPLLLVASDTVGGCVRPHRVGDLLLDAGAESYAITRPAVTDLIADLDLAGAVVAPGRDRAWVHTPAGAAPLPTGGLLGVPPGPWATDVRRVIGVLGSVRASADRLLPRRVGLGPHATLGSAVRTRLGARVRDRLVAPVAGGVYSTDPDRLVLDPRLRDAAAATGSLTAAAAHLRGAGGAAGSAVAGLRPGMFTLVDALAAHLRRLGGTIVTGTRVTSLRRIEGGWDLAVPMRPTGHVTAGTVVLAADGPDLVRLLGPLLDPDVAALAARRAETGTDVLIVTLLVHEPGLDAAPRGTGVLVAPTSGVAAKALTHVTAKWAHVAAAAGPGNHVLRLSYGRAGQAPPDRDGAVAAALRDAAALTGVPLEPGQLLASATVGWRMPGPVGPDDAAAVTALADGVGASGGLRVTGATVAGTGLASVVDHARRTAGQLCSQTRG